MKRIGHEAAASLTVGIVTLGLALLVEGAVVTQAEMNEEAAAALDAADQEMNAYLQVILKEYADTDFKERLRAAQAAWLAWREAEVDLKFPKTAEPGAYGSAFPQCVGHFKAALARARTKELRRWLGGASHRDVSGRSMRAARSRRSAVRPFHGRSLRVHHRTGFRFEAIWHHCGRIASLVDRVGW